MKSSLLSAAIAFVTSSTKRNAHPASSSFFGPDRRTLQPHPPAAIFDRFRRSRSSSGSASVAAAASYEKEMPPTAPSAVGVSSDVVDDLAPKMGALDLSRIKKFSRRGGDALFGYIERSQSDCDARHSTSPSSSASSIPCFGDFLDAGTGSHSLRWMASVLHREALLEEFPAVDDGEGDPANVAPMVSMKSYTAVTADEQMRKRVLDEAASLGVADKGDVVIGNWKGGVKVDEDGGMSFDSDSDESALLEGRKYDTILADYLVGAIDGFSPYFQDQIFHRLKLHLKPGGRLYVIGLQPIPDSVPGGDDGADVFCRITKIRDACILLANHRCYREYPLDWIERHLTRAGLDVEESRTYPIRYDHETMVRQINVGRSKLRLFPSKDMATEMGKVLDGLEKESLEVTRKQNNGRVTLGFDYVVVAEMPKDG